MLLFVCMPDTPERNGPPRPVGPPPQGVLNLIGGVDLVSPPQERVTVMPRVPDIKPLVEQLPSGKTPFLPMGTPLLIGDKFVILFRDMGLVIPSEAEYARLQELGDPVALPIATGSFPVRYIDKKYFDDKVGNPSYANQLKARQIGGQPIRLMHGSGIKTIHVPLRNDQIMVTAHPRFITSVEIPPPKTLL